LNTFLPGYDKNDLNMDYFTHVIIRNELRALTASPTPEPSVWAFSSLNDQVFSSPGTKGDAGERIPPSEWMDRGVDKMKAALSAY